MYQVKLFDAEHEKDLEVEVNRFLRELEDDQLMDIKYHVAAFCEEEQVYCFSAMVIFRD